MNAREYARSAGVLWRVTDVELCESKEDFSLAQSLLEETTKAFPQRTSGEVAYCDVTKVVAQQSLPGGAEDTHRSSKHRLDRRM